MRRSHTFNNLSWEKIKSSHIYGIGKAPSSPSLSLTLDEIAQICIDTLETSECPFDLLKMFEEKYRIRNRNSFPYSNGNEMRLAIRDHLIVTFAYWFCCDNLVPRKSSDYIKELYSASHPDFRGFRAEDGEGESFRKKYDAGLNRYSKAVRDYQQQYKNKYGISFPFLREDEFLLPPNWMLSFTMALPHSRDPLSLGEEEDRQQRLFNEDEDAIRFIASYIAQNRENIELVLRLENKCIPCGVTPYNDDYKKCPSTIDDVQLCSDETYVFTGIPFQGFPSGVIPAQKYIIKGTKISTPISTQLQMIFNNCILESGYHLHVLTLIDNYCRRYSNQIALDRSRQAVGLREQWDLYKTFSSALLFRSPMLQVPAIHAINSLIVNSCIRGSIEVKELLPVIINWEKQIDELEEMFLSSVWDNYGGSIEAIFQAINESVEEGTPRRCDRLSFLRLVTQNEAHQDCKVDKEILDCHRQLATKVYLASYAAEKGEDEILNLF